MMFEGRVIIKEVVQFPFIFLVKIIWVCIHVPMQKNTVIPHWFMEEFYFVLF